MPALPISDRSPSCFATRYAGSGVFRRSLGLLALLGLACGSPPPKPPVAPASPTHHRAVNPLEKPADDDEGMKVAGLLGSLDPDAIERGVSLQLLSAQDCFERHARRRPYLGGKVVLQYRVATDGQVKRLRISESSLGAYEVERCLLEVMGQASFASPSGGEAEFGYTLIFPERVAVQIWDPGMVVDEFKAYRQALLAVDAEAFRRRRPVGALRNGGGRRVRQRRGRRRAKQVRPQQTDPSASLVPPADLLICFYVNHRGRVLSAGLVASEPIDEEFAEKFIGNLRRVTFVATQTRYAKVTFRW